MEEGEVQIFFPQLFHFLEQKGLSGKSNLLGPYYGYQPIKSTRLLRFRKSLLVYYSRGHYLSCSTFNV